jgi:glycosyltransferase involved in cell wall biosynthesis
VDDDTQWREIGRADVAVFASLHEGYGFSLTECLALGIPTITANFGSQAEIAAAGGCLAVDPRNDEAMIDALASLLTNPSRRAELRAEALARHRRTWDEYADDLWATVHRIGVAE